MKNFKKGAAVILAAGQGTRMKSSLPKVLHTLGGKPMVWHVLQQTLPLQLSQTAVVVSPSHDKAIREALAMPRSKVIFATQKQQLGTGDAVRAALSSISKNHDFILVLNGDMPLLRTATLKALVQKFYESRASLVLTSVLSTEKNDFGRVIRHANGEVLRIIEARDAAPQELQIREVNVGVYIFAADFLRANFAKLTTRNSQNEYYLTDFVALAAQSGQKIVTHTLTDCDEALGVNTQSDLRLANQVFYERQRQALVQQGVVLTGNDIFVEADVVVGGGVHLESPCYLKGQTTIAADTRIETGVVVQNSRIGARVLVKAHSYISGADIADDCEVGPFAHLRPETKLASHVKIGNFVEIKKSSLGEGSKANHLSYLGDATIGKKVNVGAGTITCNYDGVNKWPTVIGDRVFIGSDSQLVAPVKIGEGAFVAAGTTVTQNVAAQSLVLSRVPQTEKKNWAKRNSKIKTQNKKLVKKK